MDYKLPLNSRFKQTFMHVMAENGFLVLETVPQDSATIYGKSQPNLVMFKSNSQFTKEKSITAATIKTVEKSCKVDGAALEFRKSVVQVKRGSKESCANLVKVSN